MFFVHTKKKKKRNEEKQQKYPGFVYQICEHVKTKKKNTRKEKQYKSVVHVNFYIHPSSNDILSYTQIEKLKLNK